MHDVLVICIRHNANYATGPHLAEVRIGPPHHLVQRVPVRKEPLSHALADEHDRLAVCAVLVTEIAAAEYRNAEHREESGRHNAEPRPWIFLSVRWLVAFDSELDGWPEASGVTPGHEAPQRGADDTWQLADTPGRLLVEVNQLRIAHTDSRRSCGHVEDQYVMHVIGGRRGLKRDQRCDEHSGAREQHERERNLRGGKHSQAAVGARGDPDAATRQAEAGRPVRRRQSGHKGEQHRCGERETGADPQHAGIDGNVERPYRKTGRIARHEGGERPRQQQAKHGTSAAEHQAFRQQRAAERTGTRSERSADRQLAFTSYRSRQNQIRNIRAGNDEHHGRSPKQHEQDRSCGRRNLISKF